MDWFLYDNGLRHERDKKPDIVFSELTISYSDLIFSTKTLAVTCSKKFCFLGK